MKGIFRVRDEHGATAIEYGLIAGLIALGILGSLVTTKTSLNAVFGGISSNMGAATTGDNPISSQVAAYWAAKGLTKKTFDSSNSRNIYSYADGSTVYVTVLNGVQVPNITFSDKAKNTTGTVSVNASGVPTFYSLNQFAKDNSTVLASYYTKSADFSNGVTQTESIDNYSNGNFVNTTRQAPTSSYLDQVTNGVATAKYFATQ